MHQSTSRHLQENVNQMSKEVSVEANSIRVTNIWNILCQPHVNEQDYINW